MNCISTEVARQLNDASRLWLLLDYDGTLADFAATPDTVTPDHELVELIQALVQVANIRTAIVSGRRLAHIRTLLPIPGLWLAGTYGIELQTPAGNTIHREDYEALRSSLERFKPNWESLLADKPAIYLEDKGWALAIHAKDVNEQQADEILTVAQQAALQFSGINPAFRLLGGHKFLELCPVKANKGDAINYLMENDPFAGSLPVFIGDDDKDEEAFAVINAAGGISVLVSKRARQTNALCRLAHPGEVRAWLEGLIAKAG